jgi:preprotein translocase subunit SecA
MLGSGALGRPMLATPGVPPDRVKILRDAFNQTMQDKENALVLEILKVQRTGQPILVGTHSVEESERLSGRLEGIPHEVLNARNDEVEAAIVRRAGERDAVTLSTNMAGRGTDIQLGTGVAKLGGLYVIGSNRHESVRIDNQLRGRAGRQGDPGCSRFFVSYQDELLVKYGINDETHSTPAEIQRRVEGQLLTIRQFLNKYERVAEGQRMAIQMRRQDLLDGTTHCESELERLAALITIDDMWAEYLSALAQIRSGVHWVSLSGGARDPIQSFFRFGGFDAFREYLRKIHALFKELLVAIEEETPLRLANMEANGIDPTQRGSTWTYVTTDQPFTTWIAKALRDLLKRKPS